MIVKSLTLFDKFGPSFLCNIVTEDETSYIPYSRRVKRVGVTRSEATKSDRHVTLQKMSHVNSLLGFLMCSESGFCRGKHQLGILH